MHGKNNIVECFSIGRSPLTFLYSLYSPARCTTSSVQLFSPSLWPATQQHSLVTVTSGASVSVNVRFCTRSVCCHWHTRRSRRAVFFVCKSSRTTSQSQIQYTTVQQQQCIGSRAPSYSLCASRHAGVCVCGWCTAARGDRTTTTSTRLVQQSKHTLLGLIPGARSIQQQQKQHSVAHTCTHHWNACIPPFGLKTPPGYQVSPIPKGELL